MQPAKPTQPQNRRTCSGRRKDGTPCQGPAVKGADTCRMHNGKRAGRPIIHGRYSTRLPAAVRDAYESSLTDPTLLDARQTISAMDSIVKRQAERISDGDGPTFRAEALKLVARYSAEIGRDGGDPHRALADLFAHIESGSAQMRAEMDFFDLAERVDKRTTEAAKIELSKQNAIPATKLDDLLTALVAALNAHVDAEKRKAVLADLSHTWGEPVNRVASVN